MESKGITQTVFKHKVATAVELNDEHTMQPLGGYMFLKEIKDNPFIVESKKSKFLKPKGVSFENNAEGQGEIQQLAKIFRLGEVLAVGENVSVVEVGDMVYFDDRNSVPLPLNAEEYIVRYPEQHALGVIKRK